MGLNLSGEVWAELTHVGLWTCGYAAMWTCMHLALRPIVRKTCIEKRLYGDWINRVIAVTHAIVSGAVGAYALYSEPHFADMTSKALRLSWDVDTVHGTSSILRAALPFTLGYFVYDCGVMAIDPEVYMSLMVMHHAISLFVFPMSFLSQAGSVYVTYFLATELSTPFLHPTVFFFKQHGIEGPLPTVTGLLLLVVFFFVRALPSPLLLYSLAGSWRHWADVHPAITGIAMLTLPIPPVLFTFWFRQLVKGAMKALASDDNKKDKGQ